MKIQQDTPFENKIMNGSNNRIFAIIPLETIEQEDGVKIYTAEAIEINKVSEADDVIKKYRLDTLTVIINSKEFYANAESRADISDAILEAQEDGLADTHTQEWKCKNGMQEVSLSELKQARRAALIAKGKVVGIQS